MLGYAPDTHTGKMAVRGYPHARHGLRAAAQRSRRSRPADAASDAVHHVERDYREAMAELLEVDDVRVVLAGQVLYRRYLDVADAIVAVAARLWFVVLRRA